MNTPKITIITPSFNQAQFIEQTIDSVLSQNYPNLEYIIIDGGSSDGSADIIKRYDSHLTYWVSEPDKGQSDAINKGLHRATGDVINWLNSDDYFQADALAYIGEVFSDSKVNVLCGRSRKFDTDYEFFSTGTDVYDTNLAKTIGWARIDQPETFFRKSAYDEIGGVSTSLHYLMDREWWIRYLLKYGLDGIVKSDKILVNFRLHPQSKTVSQANVFQLDHDAIFFSLAQQSGHSQIANFIKKLFVITLNYEFPYFEVSKEILYSSYMYYLLHRAHELYYTGDYKKARLILHFIDAEMLHEQDHKLHKRLLFRSNPVISSFIKSLKSWRRN